MPTKDKIQRRRVATVGTFDGLHKGHRRVLDLVKTTARQRGMESMVVCFDRHPLETVAPQKAPGLIQEPSERTNMLYREGLMILTLEFTPQLASLTAAQWLRKMHEEQGVDVLVVGYDNTFGSDGVNFNISDYRRIGQEAGVEVIEAPYEPHASSSAVRRFLREGRIGEAENILGRPFTLTGRVEEGKHLGSSIGFPTANVRTGYRAQLPLRGVYAVEVELPDDVLSLNEGSRRFMKGVANIGCQPTVGDDQPERLEVHIPGFSGNLYGKRLKVKFLRRLRDERKFDSLDDLKARIAEDIDDLWRDEPTGTQN